MAFPCRGALQLGRPLDRTVTEKGVLQLLFDARFLSKALAGGRPPAPEYAGADGAPPQPAQHSGWGQGEAGGAAQTQRKKAFAELERSLQVCTCDPRSSMTWCEDAL